MLVNLPTLSYVRHHHWLWIVRRVLHPVNPVNPIGLLGLIPLALLANGVDRDFLLPIVITLAGLLLAQGVWLGYVWLDWSTRVIRLYSDGRLDYEYGILFRRAISVSMRFGAVRYHYRDRIGTWLDCADLVLPFEAGILADIPDFRDFWEMAQGRR